MSRINKIKKAVRKKKKYIPNPVNIDAELELINQGYVTINTLDWLDSLINNGRKNR